MLKSSINKRLLVLGSIWTGLALLATGLVLTAMFRNQVVKEFEATLEDQVHEILELVTVDAQGRVALKRHPVDPRFNKRRSGWYWQAVVEGAMAERSRSLGADSLETVGLSGRSAAISFSTLDADGQALHGIRRQLSVAGSTKVINITVSGPAAVVDRSVRDFAGITVLSLGVLGFGLILGLMLQVRFGLEPLNEIGTTLAGIQAGYSTRLEGSFPREISPLVDEINALLERNAALIDRARTQAGNLAHSLKTPLTVLKNLTAPMSDDTAEVFRRQVDLMSDSVDWHVSKARVAGGYEVLSTPVEVLPVVNGLRRMFDRVHAGRSIEIAISGLDELAFKGDRHDLEEMLGNLLDNACKWGRQRVEISATAYDQRLRLTVHDDGDGIAEQDCAQVLNRGRRLDETVPGSGLGLSIVREIAELHDGSLSLGRSKLGGLAATLDLPLA